MRIGGWRVGAALFCAVIGTGPAAWAAEGTCAGDCNQDGKVAINEVVMGVNIALASMPMDACPEVDKGADGKVTIDDLVLAVTSSIKGCNCPVDARAFSGTFEAIQKTIFERHSCASQACHDSVTKQGGLDLTAENAYANLIDVPSSQSSRDRVEPGAPERSFLWQKLAIKTDPTQIKNGEQVAGSPMPQIGDALTKDELEIVRLWIYSGAPQTGSVEGTEILLNACLPPAEPITIKPLDPPAQNQGIQFVMPQWKLDAHSEHEVCFATFYDVTDQVPPEFLTPNGGGFFFDGQEIRQDPQSHHIILNRYAGPETDVHDPAFGSWTCHGGDLDGRECEPTDLQSCGAGICTSEVHEAFACIGFGPGFGLNRLQIGGAQRSQALIDFYPGVYARIPARGILIWNSHAFNLTDEDHMMNARLNYYYADNRQFPVQQIFDASHIFSADADPYTTQTICNDFVIPQYARLFSLSSHTHKHGKHFTVDLGDGSRIYESFVYNDPLEARFEPPLAFDSPDAAQRTLHFCSLYNNGVAADGVSPDPETVTRRSRVPASAQHSIGLCQPTACAAGNIGAPCNGVSDNRTCDSAPGANDGLCDACPITGGESTENEMFILIGQYYIDPGH